MERRLIVVLAAVDAVLVVVLVVLWAGVGLHRAGVPAATATPTSTATIAPTGRTVAFAMPSGNVACEMSDQGVTCRITEATFEVNAACGSTAGHLVVLDDTGVSTPCEPATQSAAGTPTATSTEQVLPYGSVAIAGQYVCESQREGVTCTDSDQVGFRLSRSALTLLH